MPQDRPLAADFGAVGYRDELTDEQLAGKHVDAVTGLVFETEEAYLNHTSPASGFTPKDIDHLENTTQPGARAIADAALDRGDQRRSEEVHPADAAEAAAAAEAPAAE